MADSKKIVWCFDPVGGVPEIDRKIEHFLTTLSQDVELEVQPVHVMSAEFFITGEYFEPIDTQALHDNISQDCQKYMSQFKFAGLKKPVVLENTYSARGSEIQFLNEYIDEKKPDFVLLSSHGRKGWSRTFLGSFAESFLLKSQVPVIVVGPEVENQKQYKTALMPVELGESSRQFVEAFLDDHRLAFLDQLTLFHKISMVDLEDIAWAPMLYGFSHYGADDILKRAKQGAETYFERLLEHPLGQKRLKYQISESLDPVAVVVSLESDQQDLIVLRSEAGFFEANLLGSVTREVIRNAKRPVIVYPHRFKKS